MNTFDVRLISEGTANTIVKVNTDTTVFQLGTDITEYAVDTGKPFDVLAMQQPDINGYLVIMALYSVELADAIDIAVDGIFNCHLVVVGVNGDKSYTEPFFNAMFTANMPEAYRITPDGAIYRNNEYHGEYHGGEEAPGVVVAEETGDLPVDEQHEQMDTSCESENEAASGEELSETAPSTTSSEDNEVPVDVKMAFGHLSARMTQ